MMKKLLILLMLFVSLSNISYAYIGDGTTLADKDVYGSPIWAHLIILKGEGSDNPEYKYARSIEANESGETWLSTQRSADYYVVNHPDEFPTPAIALCTKHIKEYEQTRNAMNKHPLFGSFLNGIVGENIMNRLP